MQSICGRVANAEQPGAVAVWWQLQAARAAPWLQRRVVPGYTEPHTQLHGWHAGLGHFTKCSVCVSYQIFGRILSRPSRSSLPCLGASYESITDYQRSIFIRGILLNNGKIRRNIIIQYLKMYDKYDLLPFCTLDFRCYKQKCWVQSSMVCWAARPTCLNTENIQQNNFHHFLNYPQFDKNVEIT